MNPIHVVTLIVFSALWLIGWIAAVVSIGSARRSMSALARGTWIAAAIILPLMGPIVWFAWGRPYYERSARSW